MKNRIEELDDLVLDDIAKLKSVITEISAKNVMSLCEIVNDLVKHNSELRSWGRAKDVMI